MSAHESDGATTALGQERNRNRCADRVSWTSVNGLARGSAEDFSLVPQTSGRRAGDANDVAMQRCEG
jgi:hypothetical protein